MIFRRSSWKQGGKKRYQQEALRRMLGKLRGGYRLSKRNATGKPKIMKIPGRSTRNDIEGRPEALNGKYRLS
jgi:hypothetical protein